MKKGYTYPAATCVYHETADSMKLVPHLGVDINDMLQTGIVKDSGETLDNNGIDDPDNVIGRISDVFDAMDAARIIKKYGKRSPQKAQAEVKEVVSSNE